MDAIKRPVYLTKWRRKASAMSKSLSIGSFGLAQSRTFGTRT
jgi:hypothetical protein